MTDREAPDQRPRVLIVEGDEQLRVRMIDDLTELVGESAEIVAVRTGEHGIVSARQIVAAGYRLPVAFIERTLPEQSGADLALTMHGDPALQRTRRVLVTQATSLSKVDAALSRGGRARHADPAVVAIRAASAAAGPAVDLPTSNTTRMGSMPTAH